MVTLGAVAGEAVYLTQAMARCPVGAISVFCCADAADIITFAHKLEASFFQGSRHARFITSLKGHVGEKSRELSLASLFSAAEIIICSIFHELAAELRIVGNSLDEAGIREFVGHFTVPLWEQSIVTCLIEDLLNQYNVLLLLQFLGSSSSFSSSHLDHES